MTTAPQAVIDLVERFARNIDRYHRPDYNETQVRREFIDPLFMALGWDVDNSQGVAPQYQEVIHEATVRSRSSGSGRGSVRSPDYCFRMGPQPRFFVEAKKPAVDIRGDIHPAYQLRRYAWSARLPLSILTDFEEFSAYDCRYRPRPKDKPAVARILYITYDQYADRWSEMASIFSRQAVIRGDYDRYAETTRGKRGTEEVNAAFLAEMEGWRVLLARNFALRNPDLSVRELNYAVQKTIDRILFLRICEDRDIEPYERLKNIVAGDDIYARLLELFRRADERYNSGLFHFRREKGRAESPDALTPTLTLDDKVLAQIIGHLYYPESPYEFSVFGADILGNVYEQFLGSVIRLTPAHRAVVEQKPEVRKAGGVYYTPQYIVDYIVEHTVGKLLEGKTPGQIGGRNVGARHAVPLHHAVPLPHAAPLRILDPACGSGSFLLGAYQYLLDYHLNWYAEHPTKGARKEIYQGAGGRWFLTTEEKKRILLNSIYGVDIDSQAVEVTKLSLLLKVLEDESAPQLALMPERALPDLADNIKCGNSLIGTDYCEQMPLMDDEEMWRVNPFDWESAFPEPMAARGFDVVIGNPPYGASSSAEDLEYFRRNYKCAATSCDSYGLLMEKSSSLLKTSGRFGMIVQSGWVSAPSMHALRNVFMDRFRPLCFASMPYDVFGAYIDTVIVIAERLHTSTTLADLDSAPVHLVVFPHRYKIRSKEEFDQFQKLADATTWLSSKENEFLVTLSDKENSIIRKLQAVPCSFSDVADIQRGVTPFHPVAQPPPINPRPAFKGTVRRYRMIPSETLYIRYDNTLKEYKPPRYFLGPRLLLRELISRQFQLQAVYAGEDFVTNKSMQSFLLLDHSYSLLYLLGILNSRLIAWYFLSIHSVGRRDDFPKIVLRQSRGLPFRTIDFNDPADVARHDRLVALVERMLALHQQLAAAKTPAAKTMLQRQIEASDRLIDRLVYELYDLTEEEIAIVEEPNA